MEDSTVCEMFRESSEISAPRSSKVQARVFACFFTPPTPFQSMCILSVSPFHFLRFPSTLFRNLWMCVSFGLKFVFISCIERGQAVCSLKIWSIWDHFLKKKLMGLSLDMVFFLGYAGSDTISSLIFGITFIPSLFSQVLGAWTAHVSHLIFIAT